jgi:hypothetical protein
VKTRITSFVAPTISILLYAAPVQALDASQAESLSEALIQGQASLQFRLR